jgi:hypothetical protein
MALFGLVFWRLHNSPTIYKNKRWTLFGATNIWYFHLPPHAKQVGPHPHCIDHGSSETMPCSNCGACSLPSSYILPCGTAASAILQAPPPIHDRPRHRLVSAPPSPSPGPVASRLSSMPYLQPDRIIRTPVLFPVSLHQPVAWWSSGGGRRLPSRIGAAELSLRSRSPGTVAALPASLHQLAAGGDQAAVCARLCPVVNRRLDSAPQFLYARVAPTREVSSFVNCPNAVLCYAYTSLDCVRLTRGTFPTPFFPIFILLSIAQCFK